ncbi:MAG TPA: tRNA dihydrouridine synthase DusB [Vicinamibacteria bacterium]|nr:tRNA dihydrouridine synthase DusB [Vicinamibacteria bacterium]
MKPLDIGGRLRLEPPLVLAPLAGHTDRAFRGLVRDLGGPGLVVTEMVSSEGLTRGSAFSRELAQVGGDERPVGIQIFGCDPARMAESAAMVEDLGADLVDVNMGCPVPKVTRTGSGAALMRNIGLAAEVVAKMVARTRIPVTVKIRSGWDHGSINAPELARSLEAAGAAAITVHPRCRSERHRGQAAWSVIRDVKQAVGIPVIGNGDVHDLESARRMLDVTGVDGIMIGRGALENPWVFRQISDGFAGRPVDSVRLDDYRTLLVSFVERLRGQKPDRRVLSRLKAFIGWVTKGLVGGATLRQSLYASTSVSQALEILESYFEASHIRVGSRNE